MKRKSTLVACLSVAALIGSSLALAANRPGAVTFSLGDAYYHFNGKRNLDNVWMPNGAIAYNFDERWAIEGGVGVISSYINPPEVPLKKSNHGFLYTVDGLYRLNPYGNFAPYLSAGVGVLAIKPNGTNSVHQGNVNAAIGTQYFVDPAIAFRVEARDLYTLARGNNDYMINLGMSFVFGGENPPVAQPIKVYKGDDFKGERT